MKLCPVCHLQVEDFFTGLCPDLKKVCSWEFEFIGTEPTPAMQNRYNEKLKRARAAYAESCANDKQNKIDSKELSDYFIDPRDGRKYKTVVLGKQLWMAENLNATKFRNGEPIPHARSDQEWISAGKYKQPAWCYYDNEWINGKNYGRLYNWHAVIDLRTLAPAGWHIPSDSEWTQLTQFLGGTEIAGQKMKSNCGWPETSDTTHNCGFSGIAIGYRLPIGKFVAKRDGSYWWSSRISGIHAIGRGLAPYTNKVLTFDYLQESGLWIRCVKDS
jgi:uncharacterized protein (TIGR02145 family)